MKNNLVIVHSYGTNSVILSGLTTYLQKYYNVYFIDLPGLCTSCPPVKNVSVEKYSQFVTERLRSLNLDSYYLCGISFGFFVISQAELGVQCKGIIAAVPFTGSASLAISKIKRFVLLLLIRFVNFTRLFNPVWNSHLFSTSLGSTGSSKIMIGLIRKTIDPETFFRIGQSVLTARSLTNLKKLPTALVVNEHDTLVDYSYTLDYFNSMADKLQVFNSPVEHQPTDLDPEYFAQVFPKATIEGINLFFESNQV